MERAEPKRRLGYLREVIALIWSEANRFVKIRLASALLLTLIASALIGLGPVALKLVVDRFAGGTYRYRTDPTISYGILPFTNIGIRVPIVSVQPPAGSGATAVTGVASVGLDALHAFNLTAITARHEAQFLGTATHSQASQQVEQIRDPFPRDF